MKKEITPEDPERLRRSMSRLYEMFKEMATEAEEKSKTRCPYKDAGSRCTANFYCQNQFFFKKMSGRAMCAGSDKLDYRPAWQI